MPSSTPLDTLSQKCEDIQLQGSVAVALVQEVLLICLCSLLCEIYSYKMSLSPALLISVVGEFKFEC